MRLPLRTRRQRCRSFEFLGKTDEEAAAEAAAEDRCRGRKEAAAEIADGEVTISSVAKFPLRGTHDRCGPKPCGFGHYSLTAVLGLSMRPERKTALERQVFDEPISLDPVRFHRWNRTLNC